MKVKIEVKKDALLKEYARIKNVPIGKVIRNATKDFLQAAQRHTPMGAKKRKSGWLSIAPEAIRGDHKLQDDGKVWFGPQILSAKDKTRLRKAGAKVPTVRKGYSKATWIGAMQALGMNRKVPQGMDSAKHVATLKTEGTGSNVSSTIRNWLGFDSKPGTIANILQQGFANAARRIRDDWARVLKRKGIE